MDRLGNVPPEIVLTTVVRRHRTIQAQVMSTKPRQSARLQLKAALTEIMEQPGAVRPERVRYFRGQMQTIITRALTDLEIKPVPSRRCFTLISAPHVSLPLGPVSEACAQTALPHAHISATNSTRFSHTFEPSAQQQLRHPQYCI